MNENQRQYREVDPYEVAVSDMNERRSSPVTSSIQESIEQQGVIQPPLVRERDDVDSAEVPYEAVVGQRRVLGAQAASGVDTIPVVVVGWGDAEALEASITENIDTFSEDVSPKDRAEAIVRLMEMRNYNQRQAADALGVPYGTVVTWIEFARDEWEGTEIHIDNDTAKEESGERVGLLDSDNDRTRSIRSIRQVTGGGEAGEEMVREVSREDLNDNEVDEAASRVRAGESPDEAVKTVAAERGETGKTREEIRLTFSGDEAEALTTAAKQWGATENQVARKVILRYLDTEGFLEDAGGDGS